MAKSVVRIHSEAPSYPAVEIDTWLLLELEKEMLPGIMLTI